MNRRRKSMGPEWVLLPDAFPVTYRAPLDVFSIKPLKLFRTASLSVAVLVLGSLAARFRPGLIHTQKLRRIAMSVFHKSVPFLTRCLPRLVPCVSLLVGIAVLQTSAYAASPWVQTVQTLANDFTGPIAKGLALVAIVWGGIMLAFTEGGDSKRMLGGILFGVGMAIGAANFLSWITG
jgi:type IV secretion system protein VirB2